MNYNKTKINEALTNKHFPTGCNLCGGTVEVVTEKQIYGKTYSEGKNFYKCVSCASYVGCEGTSKKPLGTLANKALRLLRIKAHQYLDPLWLFQVHNKVKTRKLARDSCYRWLGKQMGLTSVECHIAKFDEKQCKQVITICKAVYNKSEKLTNFKNGLNERKRRKKTNKEN